MKFISRYKNQLTSLPGDALTIATGLLYPLAFAPFSLRPLGWLSLFLLLICIQNISAKRALLRGWLWGLAAFGAGIYWLFNALHSFGGSSAIAGVFFTALVVMYLALYPALAVGFWSLCKKNSATASALLINALLFGLLWLLSEWLRSWVLTGFPWLLFGHSQLDTAFEGLFPLIGSLLTSGIVAGLIALWCLSITENKWKTPLAISLILFSISFGLNKMSWSKPTGESLEVALVQGNIPQNVKLDAKQLNTSLNTYYQLSQAYKHTDLIIWPETAMPTYPNQIQNFLVQTKKSLGDSQLITGAFLPGDNGKGYYNGLIVVGEAAVEGKVVGDDAQALVQQSYKKHQLVPFGEFIPEGLLFDLYQKFVHIPKTQTLSAPRQDEPLVINGIPMAAAICWEIAYPNAIGPQLQNANLLINLSNDAWFGQSIAQDQHLEIARVRAKEFATTIIRATNSGITVIIDPRGQIIKQIPSNKAKVLSATITVNGSTSPFLSQFN